MRHCDGGPGNRAGEIIRSRRGGARCRSRGERRRAARAAGTQWTGKTTLLRLLFGLLAADHGTVELFDQPLNAAVLLPVSGFVEGPAFDPYLSGRANLGFLGVLDRRRARPAIDEALERGGLATRSFDRVSTYSTGLRQRLGIAAALLRRPGTMSGLFRSLPTTA